ncbi:MAG TPA: hypothetical protein PK788_14645 [Gemmatimonadaceae bacterium]|nr:hypothetical protein [Gemmatimonadaceae bacterium]
MTGFSREDRVARAILLARAFGFVRESGPPGKRMNRGAWVEAIQRITGNRPGDPWCASFIVAVLTLADATGDCPIVASASCDAILNDAAKRGLIVDKDEPPRAGDLYLVMKTPTDAIHVGLVTSYSAESRAFSEISGNTNEGGSREGYGVFERVREWPGKYVFVRWAE